MTKRASKTRGQFRVTKEYAEMLNAPRKPGELLYHKDIEIKSPRKAAREARRADFNRKVLEKADRR